MSSTTEGPCSAGFKNNPTGSEHYANLDLRTLLHRPGTNNILVSLVMNTCACVVSIDRERKTEVIQNQLLLFFLISIFSLQGFLGRSQDSRQAGTIRPMDG